MSESDSKWKRPPGFKRHTKTGTAIATLCGFPRDVMLLILQYRALQDYGESLILAIRTGDQWVTSYEFVALYRPSRFLRPRTRCFKGRVLPQIRGKTKPISHSINDECLVSPEVCVGVREESRDHSKGDNGYVLDREESRVELCESFSELKGRKYEVYQGQEFYETYFRDWD